MKRFVFIAFAAILMIVLQSCSIFQKASKNGFEGVVFYTIDYPNSNFGEEVMAQLPMGMTVHIKGKMVKNDISSSMFSQSIITDLEAKTVDQLMEIMGQKLHISKTSEDIQEELAKAPVTEVKKIDETREIAGYETHKVEIIQKKESGDVTYTAWVTDELGENFLATSEIMRKVEGFPLIYEFETSNLTMRLTASKVEKKKIKDKVFNIPDSYEKVTEEEMKNRFGGM